MNPNIPVEIEAAIVKAIAKNPDERFQNADEFLQILLELGFSAGENPAFGFESMYRAKTSATFKKEKEKQFHSKDFPKDFAIEDEDITKELSANNAEIIQTVAEDKIETKTPALLNETTEFVPDSKEDVTIPLPIIAESILNETAEFVLNENEIKATRPGDAEVVPQTKGEMKATRLGAVLRGQELRATRLGTAAAVGETVRQDAATGEKPFPAAMLEKLNWMHYAGAGVIAFVLFSFVGITAVRIGQTYRNLNDLKNAYEFYVSAGNIYNEIGKEKEAIFTVNNIASIQQDSGYFNEAIKTYEETVIPYMLKYGDKVDLAQVFNGVGQSYLNINEPAKALSFFEKSLANWRLVKEKDFDEVRATYGSAIASFQLGDKSAAKNFAVKSINLAQTFNDPIKQAEVLEALAQVYTDDGDTAEAIKYRLQALNLYDRNKKANFRNGDFKTALDYIEKCLAIAQKVGDKSSEKHFWEDIAQTQEALGNSKEAKKARKNADKIK